MGGIALYSVKSALATMMGPGGHGTMMGLVDLCENPTYERSRHTKDTQGTLGVGANSSVGGVLTLHAQGPGFNLRYRHWMQDVGNLGSRPGWSDPEANEGLRCRGRTLERRHRPGPFVLIPPSWLQSPIW